MSATLTETIQLEPKRANVVDVFPMQQSRSRTAEGSSSRAAETGHGRGASLEDAPEPRVFEREPTVTLSNASRITITVLIVCANIVQASWKPNSFSSLAAITAAFTSNFVTFAGGLAITRALGRPSGAGESNWMAASYSLTQGAFVLVSGRLGAIYGHQSLSLIGMLIFSVFSLANAFANQYETFVVMRALTGMAAGVFMPNAVASITIMVPPGKSRNVLLGFFAASAPIGGSLGGFLAGGFTGRLSWMWCFVLIAIVSTIILAGLFFLFPKEQAVDRHGKIDVVGAFLGLGSLLLFNVVWNQAPSAGWQAPEQMSLLVISVAMFLVFLFWEHRFAKEPIMPLTIFRAPTFSGLIFVVLLTYMAFGIGVWYAITWQQILRHQTVMDTAIHFVPFTIASLIAVQFAAWLIPRLAAQWILGVGVAVTLVSNLVLATMPVQGTFWAGMFPAMIFSGFCPDFVFVAAQVIASNSVSRRQQGVASSLIGTLNLYGISLGLGFAGTIESELTKGGMDLVRGYRAALFFGAGLALVGLLLDLVLVRMPKDEREGWDEALEQIQ